MTPGRAWQQAEGTSGSWALGATPLPALRAQASFSRCGSYRWWLSRRWRDGAPTLLFLGLNPSNADGRRDDPTLRRLIGFADGWGYGSVEVLNLFSGISADPVALRQMAEPVGRRTDAWIRSRVRQLARQATSDEAAACPIPGAALPLWLGWGNGGGWRGRDQQMLELLGRLPVRLFCLGLTACGQPRHPLYVQGGSRLQPFGASWELASAPIAAPCPASRAATRFT